MLALLISVSILCIVSANPIDNPDYPGFNGIFDSDAQFCDMTMKEMFGVDVIEHPDFAGFMAQNGLKDEFCQDADAAVKCAAGTSEHFSMVGDECLSQFYESWRERTAELQKKFSAKAEAAKLRRHKFVARTH